MLGGCGTRGKRQKEATCGRNEAQKSTFFFSSRRQQTRYWRDWSSDVCSSDLEQEHEDVDEDQEADLPAGERGQEVLDPDMPVDAVEGEREDARADQDEEHEGRELRGRLGEIGRASCRERV